MPDTNETTPDIPQDILDKFKNSQYYKPQDSIDDQLKAAMLFLYKDAEETIDRRIRVGIMEILTGIQGFDPVKSDGFTVFGFTVYGTPNSGMNLQSVIMGSAISNVHLTQMHANYMGSTLGFDASKITTGHLRN